MHSTAFTCQPTVHPTNLPGSSLPAWWPRSPLSYVKKAFVALTENTLGLSVLLGPGWKQRFLYPASQFPFLTLLFSLIQNPNIYLLTLFALISSSRTAYAVKIVHIYILYPVHSTIQYCSFFTDMCLEWWNKHFLLYFTLYTVEDTCSAPV